MTVACVHSRLGRRPGFGEGLPRPSLVPSSSFLPTSTVSSAEPRSEDRDLDGLQVCCALQPVMGFARFPCSRTAFGCLRTWSVRVSKPFPLAKTLRSFSLPGSRLPRHRSDLLLAKEAAFTEGAFPLAVGSRRPFRVTTARASRPRPQGLHPPRSPLPEQDVSALSGPMLPWALDRIVRMPAARLLRGAHADSLFGGSFRPDGTSRRGVRRHPRVARSASFSACLAPRGPMLELTRRSAARRFRLAGSPKTATLPVPPDAPPEGNQDRSQARSSRRSTHAAPGMTRRPSGRRERSRGNPP
jgi:hypothetical protein